MWSVTGAVWDVTASMWAVTSSTWAVTSYMYDVNALCGLSHPLTLTLTLAIKKEQCMARNPNPTTVAAIRPKRQRAAATVVWLGFLDTAL